ncbi:MAG: hypothetical protein FJ405_18540 [Verrucomicrobia bacterium]|nr:hypothetical protein [Verrucomicrobiota bacterium]
MKKLLNNLAIAACAASLSVATSQAVPYKLNEVTKGTIGNLGDPQMQTWLLSVIGNYNTSNNPDLPTSGVGAVPDVKVSSISDAGTSINLGVSDYEYLVLHWGGQGGGKVQAFYLGSCADGATYLFQSATGGKISSYWYYDKDEPPPNNGGTPPNNVPDGGNSLPLLAAAAAAVAGLRYRFNV